ncbi:MAG: hypothetical protein ACRDMZ_05495 [Solirubrobacteraceae bacterium]
MRSERDELVVAIALLFAGVLRPARVRQAVDRRGAGAARRGELQTRQARSYGEMREPSAGWLTPSPRAPSQRSPDGLIDVKRRAHR